MVEVRACVYFSVLFLCFHIANGKPLFGFLWCDIMCEEDDVSTTTTSSDYMDDLLCGSCFQRPSSTPIPPAATTAGPGGAMPGGPMPGPQPPFNVMIPPSNGMNLTMWQPSPGGSWWMNLVPWGPGSGAGGPPAGPPAGAPAAPPAPPAATTAAPAATTAAAGATTAAATTPAPTTAAPAGK